MYVKLFASMFHGSLFGKRDEILVFVYLLANADADGVADIHPASISSAIGLSIEETKKALRSLESPDPESRSPDEEGRRITRLNEHRDWGWKLVNYEKYREIRHAEDRREQNKYAARRYREKSKGQPNTVVNGVMTDDDASASMMTDDDASAESAQAEAEAEAEALNTPSPNNSLMDLRKDNKVTEDKENAKIEDFQGPIVNRRVPEVFLDPLKDFPREVQEKASFYWKLFCMQHHGNCLRNLHLESTHKELRHFAKAILAYGSVALERLEAYYSAPPKEDKQLAAFQVIMKLGLQRDNDELIKPHRENRRKEKLAKIAAKKPINFG